MCCKVKNNSKSILNELVHSVMFMRRSRENSSWITMRKIIVCGKSSNSSMETDEEQILITILGDMYYTVTTT